MRQLSILIVTKPSLSGGKVYLIPGFRGFSPYLFGLFAFGLVAWQNTILTSVLFCFSLVENLYFITQHGASHIFVPMGTPSIEGFSHSVHKPARELARIRVLI